MVAFCSLAAIVTKFGFWLIAIVIAGRAGGCGGVVIMTWEPSTLRRVWLADVQVCRGEG